MLQVDIPATVRTVFGKGEARRLRKKNITPAILYSGGKDTLALQFDASELHKNLLFIHGRNAVVTLKIEGDTKDVRHVLIKEIQKDPVTEQLVHVDFLEIELDQVIEFRVPLRFTGTAKGVDMGGELVVFRNEVVLRGKPLDIPDEIETDITPLERGGAGLTLGDLQIPDSVTMLDNRDTVCVTVH